MFTQLKVVRIVSQNITSYTLPLIELAGLASWVDNNSSATVLCILCICSTVCKCYVYGSQSICYVYGPQNVYTMYMVHRMYMLFICSTKCVCYVYVPQSVYTVCVLFTICYVNAVLKHFMEYMIIHIHV